MKRRLKLILFYTQLFCVLSISGHAQFEITNPNKIPHLKNGITYIVTKDTSSTKAKEYKEIFKKYWTISKFDFINYSDVEKNLSPNNYFFSIGDYSTSRGFVYKYSDGSSMNGSSGTNTHIYLQLWGCDEKFFTRESKKKKTFTSADQIQIARIELFTDFETLSSPENIYNSDWTGDGHIRNWGKGILKNYLQQLMLLLNEGKKRTLFTETVDTEKIKELKNQTLFVPDYVLINFNKFTGNESKRHKEKEIFEDYDFKYTLLNTDALNDKILNEKQPFYYLVYIKSSTDKYLTIFNSETGEIIYTSYVTVSYNIKSKDLKEISKKIQ